MLIYIFTLDEDKAMQIVSELKDTVQKQRDNMRTLSRELTQKSVDIEAVSLVT